MVNPGSCGDSDRGENTEEKPERAASCGSGSFKLSSILESEGFDPRGNLAPAITASA